MERKRKKTVNLRKEKRNLHKIIDYFLFWINCNMMIPQ